MQRFRHVSATTLHAPEPGAGPALFISVASTSLLPIAMLGAALFDWSLSPATWNIARGSGITLYLLSWWLVVSGLAGRAHLFRASGIRDVALSLHAYAFHLWYGMLAIHVIALVTDPTILFGLVDILIPFQSPWREPWTGLGIIAAGMGIIVGTSDLIRRVLGYRVWKAIHWLSLPVFGLGFAHGIGAGTDGGSFAMSVVYLVTGAWVIFLAVYRLVRKSARASARQVRTANPVPEREGETVYADPRY